MQGSGDVPPAAGPPASVAQRGLTSSTHELIVSPLPAHEHIQSYNTQPYGNKEILGNLVQHTTLWDQRDTDQFIDAQSN